MKVQSNFQDLSQVQQTERITQPGTAGARQNAVEVTDRGDGSSLTPAGIAISQSVASSDVRMDKVVAVQRALTDGSYQVSSSDVAAKLIEHMQSNKA